MPRRLSGALGPGGLPVVGLRGILMKSLRTLALVPAAFMLTGVLASAQTYTNLYSFGTDKGGPNGPFLEFIAEGRDGNMYSTTRQTWNKLPGDVFKITPAGVVSILYTFSRADGKVYPTGGLTLATDGNFYGTTVSGGDFGYGSIFTISAEGNLTTLYSFTGGVDGGAPNDPPIQGVDGDFYGTASEGGANGDGTVFKITRSGTLTVLHGFDGTDGANPTAPLVQGTNGNFYGTTGSYLMGAAATDNDGTIFVVSSSGEFKVLFNFGSKYGPGPDAPLIQGSDGNFYGVTIQGGPSGGGIAFKIAAGGEFAVLHSFTGVSDGHAQIGGLVQATDGNFYGTNDLGGANGWGVLFRIGPAGEFATLHDFDSSTGSSPEGTLLQHTNGVLYGETAVGGTFNFGTFYSFDAGLKPFVSFLPATGTVGRSIEVLGEGLVGTTAVSLNGAPATFTVVSNTYLTMTVPSGATTGFVTVATPSGTLTSNEEFRVGP